MKSFPMVVLMGFALILSSCQREEISNADCDRLRNGLAANDVNLVNKALDNLLTTYSEANLQKLADHISGKCAVTATVLCFDCIKTNPPQSEIRFSFSQSGTTVERVLDISYTPDHRMRVVNVHD
jgi:hypothetical protein